MVNYSDPNDEIHFCRVAFYHLKAVLDGTGPRENSRAHPR